jgi:hypothetical protein
MFMCSQPSNYEITLWLDRLPFERGLDFTLAGGLTNNSAIYVETVKPGTFDSINE